MSTSWGGSLTVFSSANYSSATISNNSTLTIAPGDYTVAGNFTMGGDGASATASRINVSANGTVRIFVQGNLDIGSNALVNTGSGGGTTRFVYFYVRGTTSLQTYANINAVIYSIGDVTINNFATLSGAISSQGNTVMYGSAVLNYNATAISTANFGGSCTTATASVNNFLIDVGGGSGSNCAASTINITARDASNGTLTGYTGTVTISTSTNNGDWAKTTTAADAYGTLTPGTADAGAATYVFNASDAGTIAINLTDTHAESLTIRLNDSSAGVTSTSSTLTFSRNAFVVTSTDSLAADIIAGRNHSLRVTMMRQNTTGTSCSAATNYNVSGVKAWLTRASGDPAGTAPNLINSSNASVSLPNAKPGANNVTLNFSSGVANFTLANSDVGKYAVNFADSSNSYASSEISGSSSTYVVRPFGFYIAVTSNPAASSDAGSVFTTAGTNFTVTVTAKAYAAADDANSDGLPDNHADTNAANNADLSNNTTLAKFGAESPAETITLSSALRLPAAGVDTGLSDGDAGANDGRIVRTFTSGAGSTSQVYFAEVGIIEISASISDGDYLGAGATPTANAVSRSGFVGRFKPHQFAASAISMTSFCSVSTAFNYLAKNFNTGLTLTAQNLQSATTQNYTGGFVKLSNTGYALKARDTTSATSLTSRMQAASLSGTWSAGQLTASAALNLARASAPDGPFTSTRVGVTISDADSVALRSADLTFDSDANGSNDALLLGQSAFYFGRLRLDDAYGPETADLNVNFQTDYWTGSIWARNTADSCTTIATNVITYPPGAINVTGNRTVTVGTGNTTGTYTSLAGSAVNFASGDAGHYFSAPGSGKTGSFAVDVNLTNYAWLRFDWNNDGNYTNDTALPTARYTFGTYRGNDRTLFWQDASVP